MAPFIPTIDLGLAATSSSVIQDIQRAASTIGFLHVVNHGISTDLINDVFDVSGQFFKGTPTEEKRKYAIGSTSNFGWTNVGVEKLDEKEVFGAQKGGDVKEAFNIGKLDAGAETTPQELPEVLKKNKDTLNKFERECHRVCMDVLRALAKAYEVPDPEWFGDRHIYEKTSGDVLRLLWYPETEGSKETDSLPSKRCSEHSDYGSITALFQRKVGGLQVLSPDTSNGHQWIDAPVVDGAILINFGDLLQLWTNDKIKSTVHRVEFDDRKSYPERFSIAYFCHANNTVKVSPIPGVGGAVTENGETLTAWEHLQRRLASTYTYETPATTA